MGKVDEAEEFLREGLQANPNNPALLFEMGSIYHENRNDDVRARNLWELGVRKWDEQKGPKTDQDNLILLELTLGLSRLEEDHGNFAAAVQWLERVKTVSPNPDVIAKQIEDDRQKLAESQKSGAAAPAATGGHSP